MWQRGKRGEDGDAIRFKNIMSGVLVSNSISAVSEVRVADECGSV